VNTFTPRSIKARMEPRCSQDSSPMAHRSIDALFSTTPIGKDDPMTIVNSTFKPAGIARKRHTRKPELRPGSVKVPTRNADGSPGRSVTLFNMISTWTNAAYMGAEWAIPDDPHGRTWFPSQSFVMDSKNPAKLAIGAWATLIVHKERGVIFGHLSSAVVDRSGARVYRVLIPGGGVAIVPERAIEASYQTID